MQITTNNKKLPVEKRGVHLGVHKQTKTMQWYPFGRIAVCSTICIIWSALRLYCTVP